MQEYKKVMLAALRDYEYKLDAHYDGHPNALDERDAARAAIAAVEAQQPRPIRICNNADCGWSGYGEDTVSLRGIFPVENLCPYCRETTEEVPWESAPAPQQPAMPQADWSQADPDETHWAVESNGRAYFHKIEPHIENDYEWVGAAQWRFDRVVDLTGINWRKTLQRRPDTEVTGG